MKIVIVGPGAIGLLLASILSKTKEEIWLLDKDKERASRISKNGISVTGIGGDWKANVKITANTTDIGQADLVVICVKSYHTKDAVNQAKSLVGENSKVLTLQNGIGNIELISEAVGSEKTIGGITNLGATLLGEGRVKFAGKGETVLGRSDGKLPVEMRAIREIFNKCGLETRLTQDIKGLLWSKLIINAGINALGAITRLKNGSLLDHEGTRKILRGAVTEATRVAKRKRIKLIYDDPLAKAEAVCEATCGNVCSMLADVLMKKRTEIDFINGVVVRLGQELNIPVPYNAMLADLVKTIEASYAVAAG